MTLDSYYKTLTPLPWYAWAASRICGPAGQDTLSAFYETLTAVALHVVQPAGGAFHATDFLAQKAADLDPQPLAPMRTGVQDDLLAGMLIRLADVKADEACRIARDLLGYTLSQKLAGELQTFLKDRNPSLLPTGISTRPDGEANAFFRYRNSELIKRLQLAA
jgi:hypothetical protein